MRVYGDFELTHVITGNTSVLCERWTVGNNEHTWEYVRWMQGRQLDLTYRERKW